jgi:hypothetical protein
MNKDKLFIAYFSSKHEKALEEFKSFNSEFEFHPLTLKGIRNPLAYMRGQWCLKTIGQCLPDGFDFTDLDGFMSFYGVHLFLEFKKSPIYLNKKQLAAFFSLAQDFNTTVFLAFGEPCAPTSYLIINKEHPFGSELIPTDPGKFQNVLLQWCNKNKPTYISSLGWDHLNEKADITIKRILKSWPEQKNPYN